MAEEPQSRDTIVGYLRRTGPATAELFDKNTGEVYGFNFDAFAEDSFSTMDGRGYCDWLFEEPGKP